MKQDKYGLNDNEIMSVIKTFIGEENNNYAVMINGQWGIGKTYFVKERLIKEIINDQENVNLNSKTMKVLYLSLYGISEVNEIKSRILQEILLYKKFVNNKYVKVASSLTKEILLGLIESSPAKGVTKVNFGISDFVNFNNTVIVFDDIERCNISILELLGYINNFIEHDKMKIILIANEEEIIRNELSIEKLNFAANHNSLLTQITKEELPNSSNIEEDNISLDKLKSFVDKYLCDENQYLRIKEKVIGRTIEYSPDISNIILNMVKNSLDIEFSEVLLLDIATTIEEKSIQLNHINFRTVHFICNNLRHLMPLTIERFSLVESKFNTKIIKEVITDISKEIIMNIIVTTIRFKSGEEIYPVSMNAPYINNYNQKQRNDLKIIYKFINSYIKMGYVSNSDIQDAIELRSSELISIAAKNADPIVLLRNQWYLLMDNEIIDNMNRIYIKVKNNEYSVTNYLDIIYLNIHLSNLGFNLKSDEELRDYLISDINNSEVKINDSIDNFLPRFDLDKDSQIRFNQIIKEINECIKKKVTTDMLENLINMFNEEEDFNSNLIKAVHYYKNQINDNEKFISFIPIDVLENKLKNSNSKEINDFRTRISRGIYRDKNFSTYFLEEKEYIEELISRMENLYNSNYFEDKILKNNIYYLINDFKVLL